jgi:hypothetical protein
VTIEEHGIVTTVFTIEMTTPGVPKGTMATACNEDYRGHTVTQAPSTGPTVVVETAWSWWKRCHQRDAATPARPAYDPSSAAWEFVRGASGTPVDAAWKRSRTLPSTSHLGHPTSPDVVSIDGAVGKTWMLISLAARFVVDTRASRFPPTLNGSSPSTSLPFVVIFDSSYDITPSKVRQVVQSTLLRQPNIDDVDMCHELVACLDRIHVATVADDTTAWVPLLEALRWELKYNQDRGNKKHPALLLWDGFLTEPASTEPGKMEVIRQVVRLLEDCSVVLVYTTGYSAVWNNRRRNSSGRYRKIEWLGHNRGTHRIWLDRHSGKQCVAEIHGIRIPFSLSSGGILS